jgi:hypothetical protein
MFNYGPGVSSDDRRPIVHTDNSPFCLMGAREIVFGGNAFPVKVREIRGNEVSAVEGGGWIGWSMYSGWAPQQRTESAPVAWPALEPDGEGFLESLSVTGGTTTADATLRYTVDGSEPTPASPVLPVPLVLSSSVTLKVKGFAPGRPASATRSAEFQQLVPRPADMRGRASRQIAFSYYELADSTDRLPDFSQLQPTATGVADALDLSQRKRDQDFALRYTSWFDAPADGLYNFYTTSDDGSRLWIGDTLVVDNDGSHAAQTRSGRIALRAGPHPLTVGYQQGGGEFLLRVEVEGPGLSRRILTAVK